MAVNPIYAFEADEIGHTATVSLASGTAHAEFPVTKVQNFEPADIFLTTTTTAVDLVWDHGAAADVKVFSLHHHNIPAGLSGVKIQRNASNSWGSPTIDHTLAIPAYPNDGLPLPLAVDLTEATGYSASGFRYSRLHIPSPSQITGIGAVCWWGEKRQGLRHSSWSFRPIEQHPTRIWPTAFGVKNRYLLGSRVRRLDMTIKSEYVDTPTWIAWFRAAGGNGRPFLYWFNPYHSTLNSGGSTDGWLASFESDTDDMEHAAANYSPMHIVIEERTGGVAVPTA